MLGVDLIEVCRIKQFIDSKTKQQLLRIFTQREIDYAFASNNKYQRFAARFAAKEAFYKAFGSGNLKEIELSHDNNKPIIKLYGITKELWNIKSYTCILVSVSHTKNYATATVLINK